MAMTLRIRDHAGLQAAAGRAAIGSSAYLLGTALLGTSILSPVGLAGGVLVLGLAVVPPRSLRSLATAGALAAAAAGAALIRPGSLWGLSAAAALLGMMYARESRPGWRSRLLAALSGGAAAALGVAVLYRLQQGEIFADLSLGVERLGAGAVLGLFAGLGAIGREVQWLPAKIEQGQEVKAALLPEASGELGTLLGRANQAFTEARAALGSRDGEVAHAAADLMSKIERFARRWQDLDAELARTDPAALAERLAGIRARATATQDEVARAEYASAEAALTKQVEYLGGIERGRERALARLHHQVAVLERLRFAALHRRAVAANQAGEELQPLVEELVAAGRDLDCEAEAIAELPAVAAS
jgi:hypothetical protein